MTSGLDARVAMAGTMGVLGRGQRMPPFTLSTCTLLVTYSRLLLLRVAPRQTLALVKVK